MPHPMFVPMQGYSGASRGLPFYPAIGPHGFPFGPYFPQGYVPRIGGKGSSAQIAGEGPPQLRKLFIGGLSHETTDDQLRQFYSQWGTVVDCIVIRDPQTKYSRGFGFVTYATMQMAEAAMADRPHTINGKVVDPKRAIPREQMSPLLPNQPPPFLEGEPEPGCKLSLSGIHWDYHTVDGLRHYFDSFGIVEQVEILGNPRGLGFVVFEEKAAADKCLAHGKIHVINGRKCEVTLNPIEHSIYQRNEMNSNEEVDVAAEDEKADSSTAVLSETNSECNASSGKTRSASGAADQKCAHFSPPTVSGFNFAKGIENKNVRKETSAKHEKKKTGKKSAKN